VSNDICCAAIIQVALGRCWNIRLSALIWFERLGRFIRLLLPLANESSMAHAAVWIGELDAIQVWCKFNALVRHYPGAPFAQGELVWSIFLWIACEIIAAYFLVQRDFNWSILGARDLLLRRGFIFCFNTAFLAYSIAEPGFFDNGWTLYLFYGWEIPYKFL
jgi:hypothetical protein